MVLLRAELRGVTLKKTEFDLRTGLLRSSLLPWVAVEVDSGITARRIAEEVPLSHDVTEWMHVAAADVAVFDAMAEEYNRLGSELLSASGDPYIPGVRCGDLRGESVPADTVRARGYGRVLTPEGDFRVPVRGKATFAKGGILAWGAIPYPGTGVQWVLTLLQWKDLARPPVRERVRFASSHGLVAPNFFHIPSAPVPVRTLVFGLTSDRRQVVVIRGRGTRGSYERVLFESSFEVDAGESEVVYNVIGFPSVPAFTLEIQPSDNTQTVLDYLLMVPPV